MESEVAPSGKYPFAGLALAAIAGILLSDYIQPAPTVSGVVAGLALVLWLFVRKTFPLLVFVSATFFLVHGLQFDRNPGRELAQLVTERGLTVTGSGTVDSVPVRMVSSNDRVRSSFQIRDARIDLGNGRLTPPIALSIKWPDAGPEIGSRIQFEGLLRRVEKPRNPGEFDYAAWLARKQIFSEISVPLLRNARVVAPAGRWDIRRLAAASKLRLAEIITRDLAQSPIEAGVISAMILGTNEDTPDATVELFMKTGTLHLFSVSGLHVAMLAAITLFVLVMLRVPRRIALLLTIPAVFGYALITGWSPSSVRAALMTTVFVVATLLDRPSLSVNTLSVSGFLLLAFNTNQLFATGFQLSFSVVAAIVLLSGPIAGWLQRFSQPDPFIPRKLLTRWQKSRWHLGNRLAGNLGLTISAWIGSLPLTACYFNILSPVALFANLVIVPLAFVILSLGVLSIMLALTGNWLVIALNNANWAVVKVLLAMLGLFADLPAGAFFVGPHWWQSSGEARATFFDLGSGGAAAIETRGACWLIDCGSEVDYRRVVRHYLQTRGINRVDGIFLTHGDGTHIGGISLFRVDFPEAKIFVPAAGHDSPVFRKLLSGIEVTPVSSGSSWNLDTGARVDVLWPPAQVDGSRADEHCLMLKMRLGEQTFLLTSDAGFTPKQNLLDANRPLNADWLVSGRNREDPGDTKKWLQKIAPQGFLATATGFPTSEQIPPALEDLCARLHIPLVRFDRSGAVQFVVSEDRVEMIPFLGRSDLLQK